MTKNLEDKVERNYGGLAAWSLDPEVDRVALQKFAEKFQEQFGNEYGTCRDGERYDSCK